MLRYATLWLRAIIPHITRKNTMAPIAHARRLPAGIPEYLDTKLTFYGQGL